MFIPIVTLPFAEGYQRNFGVLGNLQSMTLTIVPDKYAPDFRDENSISGFEYYWKAAYGNSGRTLLFHSSVSDQEAAKAIRAASKQIQTSTSKYLVHYGWKLSWKGLHLPFSFLISGSALLMFAGIVLLIFATRRS
jgi:hypothetical protein